MRLKTCAFLAASFLLAIPVQSNAADGAAEYLSPWKKGYFDIYTIATGKGENSFLIFPDGTTMLVDCGDMTGTKWNGAAVPDSTKSPAAWVAEFVRHFSKSSKVDYFLLTHLHEDHLGRLASYLEPGMDYRKCGVAEVVDHLKFSRWIDRGWPDYSFLPLRDEKKKTISSYSKFVSMMNASGKTRVEKIELGSRTQVKPRHKVNDFEVWTVAANGSIYRGEDKSPITMITEKSRSVYDENCFSIAQLFTYGKFSYYNGGDLPSGHWKSYFGKYDRDFESRVAETIGHPVTVSKMSHHGCPDSSNSHILWILRPQAFIVSCAESKHPSHDTVERVMDPHNPCGKLIFPTQYTCREQIGSRTFSKLQPAGHIVVRVYEGGNSYQIFVLDSKSTDYRIIHKTDVVKL